MTLDDFVRGIEQDAYVYRIVGNHYYIGDSVHIVPLIHWDGSFVICPTDSPQMGINL